jgi:hypothetical protein
MDAVSHTVEVTAATLYEAVAQGLAAIRRNEMGRRDRAGIQHRQGVSRGRSGRARSQTGRFHKVVGKGRRLSTRGERSSPDSLDLGRAGFTIESNFFLQALLRQVSTPLRFSPREMTIPDL